MCVFVGWSVCCVVSRLWSKTHSLTLLVRMPCFWPEGFKGRAVSHSNTDPGRIRTCPLKNLKVASGFAFEFRLAVAGCRGGRIRTVARVAFSGVGTRNRSGVLLAVPEHSGCFFWLPWGWKMCRGGVPSSPRQRVTLVRSSVVCRSRCRRSGRSPVC